MDTDETLRIKTLPAVFQPAPGLPNVPPQEPGGLVNIQENLRNLRKAAIPMIQTDLTRGLSDAGDNLVKELRYEAMHLERYATRLRRAAELELELRASQ